MQDDNVGLNILRCGADILGTHLSVQDDNVGLNILRCGADILGTHLSVQDGAAHYKAPEA